MRVDSTGGEDGAATLVVSRYQIAPLLDARRRGLSRADTSPDLGRTAISVPLDAAGVTFPGDLRLAWDELEHVAASTNACFRWDDGRLEPIKVYSRHLDRLYTLMPTPRAPTMLVSGIPMHRIKGTDPVADTERKIAAVRPVLGRVLDTATGLGYTAVAAAATAESVVTVELDPAVIEVARANPWSQELFSSPRIEQRIADTAELIAEFPAAAFDRIVHDPPTLSLAGQLFSGAFYSELYRVLRPRGRLFHYIGNPERTTGARVGRGVVRRLREAGFTRVEERPDAFGVVAHR